MKQPTSTRTNTALAIRPLRRTSLSVEAEFENSNRNDTVNNVRDGVVFLAGNWPQYLYHF
jgi:hypothetical protein